MRKNTVSERRILGESKTHLPDKEIVSCDSETPLDSILLSLSVSIVRTPLRLREKVLKKDQFVLSVSFESLSIFCTIKLCRTTCDKIIVIVYGQKQKCSCLPTFVSANFNLTACPLAKLV